MGDIYAKQAIKFIVENMERVAKNPSDLEARIQMEIASMMAAIAFSNSGLGAVHGISQTIGSIAHIPHGKANALLLPYVMEINIQGNLNKYAEIGRLLGSRKNGEEAAYEAVEILKKWLKDYGMTKGIGQSGLTEEMIPQIIEGTMGYRLLSCNPVAITEEKIRKILCEAW